MCIREPRPLQGERVHLSARREKPEGHSITEAACTLGPGAWGRGGGVGKGGGGGGGSQQGKRERGRERGNGEKRRRKKSKLDGGGSGRRRTYRGPAPAASTASGERSWGAVAKPRSLFLSPVAAGREERDNREAVLEPDGRTHF